MDERGLTQRELSELADVRQASISALSRGFVSRVDIGHIERLVNALGLTDINELITLEEE